MGITQSHADTAHTHSPKTGEERAKETTGKAHSTNPRRRLCVPADARFVCSKCARRPASIEGSIESRATSDDA
jgi:hypothetical protein